MTRFVSALCMLTTMTSLAAAAESEWPGWLGPNRDGKSPDTGLLKQWPEEGPNLLWQADDIGVLNLEKLLAIDVRPAVFLTVDDLSL